MDVNLQNVSTQTTLSIPVVQTINKTNTLPPQVTFNFSTCNYPKGMSSGKQPVLQRHVIIKALNK